MCYRVLEVSHTKKQLFKHLSRGKRREKVLEMQARTPTHTVHEAKQLAPQHAVGDAHPDHGRDGEKQHGVVAGLPLVTAQPAESLRMAT